MDYWLKSVIQTIKKFPEILPTPIKKSNERFDFQSNPHSDLDLKLKLKNLLDIDKNPQSWRIIFFFNNTF